MKPRIGFLGGSFNPPHFGHLRPALEVLQALQLEKVVFIPSGQHPLKSAQEIVSAEHRLAMVERAIQSEPNFLVDSLEVKTKKVSYTVNTLETLTSQKYRNYEPILLLGADLLGELHLWRGWQKLIKLAHLCIMIRPGYKQLLTEFPAQFYLHTFTNHSFDQENSPIQGPPFSFFYQTVTPFAISSTEIRQQLRLGSSVRYLTPEPVIQYIQKNDLYQ